MATRGGGILADFLAELPARRFAVFVAAGFLFAAFLAGIGRPFLVVCSKRIRTLSATAIAALQ